MNKKTPPADLTGTETVAEIQTVAEIESAAAAATDAQAHAGVVMDPPAEAGSAAETRPATEPGSGTPAASSARRRATALRHDPAEVRRLFETGEYPYKTHIERKGAFGG